MSDGEAGITSIDPAEAGPIRRREQEASCAVVGADDVTFLGGPMAESSRGWSCAWTLRAEIRRRRPEVVVSINYRDSWGPSSWNHADHRAVGRSLLDVVRDAANPWVFSDRR